MRIGGLVYAIGKFNIFAEKRDFFVNIGTMAKSFVRLGIKGDSAQVAAGGVTAVTSPAVSPAYLGVSSIIGPRLAALNFTGCILTWGLMVPLLLNFLGPPLKCIL